MGTSTSTDLSTLVMTPPVASAAAHEQTTTPCDRFVYDLPERGLCPFAACRIRVPPPLDLRRRACLELRGISYGVRMLTTLAVDNYRSLRDLVVPLRRLTLVTGANGTGKSSLYRSLRLLARSARNGAIAALAREGGLPGTLWAGPDVVGRAVREGRHPVQGTVRRGPVGLRLGFSGDAVGYAVDFGLPEPRPTAFHLDPEIKRESVWVGPILRRAALVADRDGPSVRVRDSDGEWQVSGAPLHA